MRNQSLLYDHLDLKLKEVIDDNEKRKRIIDEVITITTRIQINDKSLKELMEDPEYVDISFSVVYPFIYAVVYKNDKNIYTLFVSKDFSSLLFVFELMAWSDVYNKSLDNFLRITKDLPQPLIDFIEDVVGTPRFAPQLRNAWIRVREEYIKKVEESMLDDIRTYLNVEDKEVIKNVMKEVSGLMSSEKFPPPPYSIIHNNIHCGAPIQFDRTPFFVECLNSSQKSNWAFPELGDLWFEIFRYSLLGNQFSLQGLREVIRKFMSAQGDLKRLFKSTANKWAKKREYEYQYPVHFITRSLMVLSQEPRRPISIDELKDFEFLEGCPAWSIKKIIFADNNEIKRAVSVFKEGLSEANSKYFNYFFWENNKEIIRLANDFHSYTYREGRSDQWMNLVTTWISQFEDKYMMDLALDILKNILFIKTEDVCKEFNDWIVRNNLLENLKEKKVLLVYEPDSSVVNVFNHLRGQYLKDVTLTEHAYRCECTLNLIKKDDGELVPTENKFIEYLKKDSSIWPSYFTKGESKWTDIIYIEDNIGTGGQASEKIHALRKYIKTAGLDSESVNVKYWSYVVADRNRLTEKLSTKGIDPNVIEAKIDLQNLIDTQNKLVYIDKLLQEKYPDEKDELKEKLEKICSSILKNAPSKWSTDRKHWFGYGGLGLLLVFEHGTPNNSIPILWRDSMDPVEFFALFPRGKSTEQDIVWKDVDSVLKKFQGRYL